MWKTFLSSETFFPRHRARGKSVGNSNLKHKIGVHYSTQLHTQYKHLRSEAWTRNSHFTTKSSPASDQMFSCRNVIFLACFRIISKKFQDQLLYHQVNALNPHKKGRRQWPKPPRETTFSQYDVSTTGIIQWRPKHPLCVFLF